MATARHDADAVAAKRVLAEQAVRRMSELRITTAELARRMETSRTQVRRIIDADYTGVAMDTLFRLASALRLPLHLELLSGQPDRADMRQGHRR